MLSSTFSLILITQEESLCLLPTILGEMMPQALLGLDRQCLHPPQSAKKSLAPSIIQCFLGWTPPCTSSEGHRVGACSEWCTIIAHWYIYIFFHKEYVWLRGQQLCLCCSSTERRSGPGRRPQSSKEQPTETVNIVLEGLEMLWNCMLSMVPKGCVNQNQEKKRLEWSFSVPD